MSGSERFLAGLQSAALHKLAHWVAGVGGGGGGLTRAEEQGEWDQDQEACRVSL